MKSNDLQIWWLGQVGLGEVRKQFQEPLFRSAIEGESHLLFCQHPPTITFGRNMKPENIAIIKESLTRSWAPKLDFFECERGGQATYHGPAYLMIYPIIRVNKLGVRRFVEWCFQALVELCAELGISAYYDSNLQGLWVKQDEVAYKLASLGLRVHKGVSDYGICLYVEKSAAPFSLFPSCGVECQKIITIEEAVPESLARPGFRASTYAVAMQFTDVFKTRFGGLHAQT